MKLLKIILKVRALRKELEALLESKNIKFKSIFEIGCGAGGALNYFLEIII